MIKCYYVYYTYILNTCVFYTYTLSGRSGKGHFLRFSLKSTAKKCLHVFHVFYQEKGSDISEFKKFQNIQNSNHIAMPSAGEESMTLSLG